MKRTVKWWNMPVREYRGKGPTIDPTSYIEASATIIGDVTVGKNSSIWDGAVLRGDMHYIRIGRNSNVQDNSVLHGTARKYPTIVGDNVSIGHSAIVHGCIIGNNCLIGMGSVILEGVEIGDWCIVGAGAVITEGTKVPSGSIALGIPAKIKTGITRNHKERITRNWREYVRLKNSYSRA